MSANHWHKRYHSDALTGFMSLTLEERGAYQTILDMIYDRGGPIVSNDRLLAGYMGVSLRKWAALRDALVAKGKIVIDDGHITNARAISEIEKAAKTSRKHAENGSKGGLKSSETRKKGSENKGDGEAQLQPGSSLSRYQIPEEANASTRASDFSTIDFAVDLCRKAGVALPDHGTAERNRKTVDAWIAAGADQALIREVVVRRSANSGTARHSLAYFNNPVREAIAERDSAATALNAGTNAIIDRVLGNQRNGVGE